MSYNKKEKIIQHNTLIVFDFESGGITGEALQPLQLAAVAINPYSLEFVKGFDGQPDSFNSFMRPTNEEALDPKAMAIHKIPIEELRIAPLPEVILHQFAEWCSKYTMRGKQDEFSAPIPCGYNILGFDLPLLQTLCEKYNTTQNKLVRTNGKQSMFNGYHHHDIMDYTKFLFNGQKTLPNYKFDTVREHMGISSVGAHRADIDVLQEGEVLIKYLKLMRNIFPRVSFKDCLKKGD